MGIFFLFYFNERFTNGRQKGESSLLVFSDSSDVKAGLNVERIKQAKLLCIGTLATTLTCHVLPAIASSSNTRFKKQVEEVVIIAITTTTFFPLPPPLSTHACFHVAITVDVWIHPIYLATPYQCLVWLSKNKNKKNSIQTMTGQSGEGKCN